MIEKFIPGLMFMGLGLYLIISRRGLAERDQKQWFSFARFVHETTVIRVYFTVGLISFLLGVLVLIIGLFIALA